MHELKIQPPCGQEEGVKNGIGKKAKTFKMNELSLKEFEWMWERKSKNERKEEKEKYERKKERKAKEQKREKSMWKTNVQ